MITHRRHRARLILPALVVAWLSACTSPGDLIGQLPTPSPGAPLASVTTVASFGVSPLDREVDRQLRSRQLAARGAAPRRGLDALLGPAALASAQVVYQHFRQRFSSARFAALRDQGAQVQRLLWAATEVTLPGRGDTRYVEFSMWI